MTDQQRVDTQCSLVERLLARSRKANQSGRDSKFNRRPLQLDPPHSASLYWVTKYFYLGV